MENVDLCSIMGLREMIAMNEIGLLVLEDEIKIAHQYKELSKRYPLVKYLGSTSSASEALEMCKKLKPNSIVVDLELQQGEGTGLDFLKSLQKLNLSSKPYIIVVTNNISTATHKMARQLGADFIITKNQKDYSAKMVLDLFRTYNETYHCFDDELLENDKLQIEVAMEYRTKLKERISEELDSIGISPKVKGRKYLRDAIEMTCDKDQPNLCSRIAKNYSVSSASVERAMQGAINRAWNTTDTETLETKYTAYINPERGYPTIMEFICYYADKVKK